jgi:hypothetical protein
MLKQSQKTMILNRLEGGYNITPIDALKHFRCMRLAAVIKTLRDEGHNIITKTVYSKGKGNGYAQYTLIPKKHGN